MGRGGHRCVPPTVASGRGSRQLSISPPICFALLPRMRSRRMQATRVLRRTVPLTPPVEMTPVQHETPGAMMNERFMGMERCATISIGQARLRVLISALLLTGLLVTLVPAVSRAASLTVTNTNNDGSGSLRQALLDAKAAVGDDTITFDLNDCPCTITVTSELVIDSNVTIEGPGADMLTVSGGGSTRVFWVTNGVTAALDGLTISNGSANEGGGILNASSTLTITNSTFTGNYADWGGAVLTSWGTLTVINSTFSGNSGFIGAAIHSGDSVLRVENTTVERNQSNYIAGGLSSLGSGSATIVDSIFADNGAGSSGYGGGVYANTDLTVINSTFSNNDAGEYGSGGGIAMFDGHLSITGSSFIENTADAGGGYGGGIFTTHSASIEVAESEFVENTSWMGGAIYLEADSTINTISNSTFDRNRASDTGGALYAGVPVNIVNSTFSGNTARRGGGIGSYHFGSAADNIVANSAFSGNSATDVGSSIATWSGITITGSIFAGNGASSCSALHAYYSDGEVIDGGYNLSNDATCVSADTSLANTDPLLGPLTDNGGPTRTHALLSDSPALDRIPVGTLGCGTTLTTDQRGVERPQREACDIGAFELLFQYDWNGFSSPIDNEAVNAVKAGSAAPVKFTLAGDPGLAAVISITSGAVACDSSEPVSDVVDTVSAGSSSLRYDAGTGQYTYIWKTDKAWSKSCRQLTVTLADGSSYEAQFSFK